jgi:hypothetical protein
VDAAAPSAHPAKKEVRKKRVSTRSDSSGSDDEEDWKSESDESSESDIDIEGSKMEDLRKFFLKYVTDDGCFICLHTHRMVQEGKGSKIKGTGN